jgi:hypothetical protein
MRESADLDEPDRLLITTPQTSPRANWQQVGQVLGTSASTAARRWDRLTKTCLAWISSARCDCREQVSRGQSSRSTVLRRDSIQSQRHSPTTRMSRRWFRRRRPGQRHRPEPDRRTPASRSHQRGRVHGLPLRRRPVATEVQHANPRPEGRRIRTVPFSLWPEQGAIAAEHKLLNDIRTSSQTPVGSR